MDCAEQTKGAIFVAQRTGGVAGAGRLHSFPPGGFCHCISDLSTKTYGEQMLSWEEFMMGHTSTIPHNRQGIGGTRPVPQPIHTLVDIPLFRGVVIV